MPTLGRNVPQFGEPDPGRAAPDRPAAFAIVPRDRRIAVVRVTFATGGGRLDLPGGGLDPGETPAQAAVRECGEEAGLRISVGEPLTRADHYFVNMEGETNNTRGTFYAATLLAEAPELKTEADHALEWMTPDEALVALDRESHAWALTAWLRRLRRDA
jgi:8-oxo-dGTP diphosphatase